MKMNGTWLFVRRSVHRKGYDYIWLRIGSEHNKPTKHVSVFIKL